MKLEKPTKANLGDIYEMKYYGSNNEIYFHAIGYITEFEREWMDHMVKLKVVIMFKSSNKWQEYWKIIEKKLYTSDPYENQTKGTSKIDIQYLGTKEEHPEYFL